MTDRNNEKFDIQKHPYILFLKIVLALVLIVILGISLVSILDISRGS